ncbi:phage major capsid protein [Streptomyces microflavus]|uniref:phage major capsid family protein n=1 Tax=Streptomyces microflavus TaxID=1919 RepID=UPI003821C653
MTFAHSTAHHFDARQTATDALRALTQRGIKTDADKARETELLATIARHDRAAKDAIDNAATRERAQSESFANQAASRAGIQAVTDAPAARSLDDVAPLGVSVRSTDWTGVDSSDTTVTETLNAAGKGSRLLSLVSSFPFKSLRGRIAVDPRLTADATGRNDPLEAIANPVQSGVFEAAKISAFVSADRDELTDFPVTETAVSNGLTAAVGQRVDDFLLNGAVTTDGTFEGLLDGAVDTAVTAVDAKALLDAAARVQDSGSEATHIVARPSEIAAIVANVDGSKLDRLPALLAIPDLADGSAVIPVGKILVGDLSSVAVAIRAQLEFMSTTDHPAVHDVDAVLMGARTRVGNPKIATPGRIQTLTVSAG